MAFLWLGLTVAALVTALFGAELGLGNPLRHSALVIAGLSGLLWLRQILLARRARARRKRILIDGSNVIHWNDGTPDVDVLRQVVQALASHNCEPAVIFDANVGYKLADRYMNEATLARRLGLLERQVMVSPKGEPADGFLLQAARDMDAPIVTNDRFRDWQEDFPEVAEPGRLIHGGYRNGAPYLRPGKGKPA